MRALLLTAFLLAVAGFGITPAPAAAAQARVMESGGEPLTTPLQWRASYWRDPSGRVSLDEVARLPDGAFQAFDRTLVAGFTADVVWLRVDIERPSDDLPRGWWLEVDQTVMEKAQLFAVQGLGRYTEMPRLEHRRPLFVLQITETGTQRYLMRLATRASMSTGLTLWQPQAMVQANARETYLWGAVFGAYLLVVFFYFGFWSWTREQIHLVYTAYVAVNFLAAFFTGGWPSQLLPQVTAERWLDLLGVWIAISPAIAYYFGVIFLRLDLRWPRSVRALIWITCGLSVTGVLGIALGQYQRVVPTVQLVSVVIIILTLAMAIQLARERRPEARFFLIGFSFFYLGVACRYARNFGLVEPGFWTDNGYQIGAFLHMLVMSTGIFSAYNRLRRDKELAEARADAETRLRAEQQDFSSMVSHEFRTPLSIIAASADNLLHDEGLEDRSRQRVEKILKAQARMTALMENYLSKERLALDSRALTPAVADVAALCRRIAQDLRESGSGPVRLEVPAALVMPCDAGLVEIALHNLLTNAFRHAPAGEVVTLAVLPSKDRQSVQMVVRDTGPGIADEDLAQIFERFYRGRGALDKPGAGLGLYLVRRIAERHGGRAHAKNLAAGGCEIGFTLPAQAVAA